MTTPDIAFPVFSLAAPSQRLLLPVGMNQLYCVGDVVRSQTAQRQNIDNLLPFTAQHYANACALTDNVLMPIRLHFGARPEVSSWFRCVALNKAIGGVATSQHCEGAAIDFTVAGVSLSELYNWIAFESQLPFDQLIFEFNSWIHVSYDRARTRGQRLRIDRAASGYKRVLKPLAA